MRLTGIDVRSASFEGTVRIRHRAPGIIMEMRLNIAPHNPPQGPHKIINLPRVGTSHSISHAHPIHTDLVDGLVDTEQIDKVGSEGIFG